MASIGEARVRVEFNPSNNNVVDRIKFMSSECIDLCEDLRGAGGPAISGEKARLIALAQTAYEEAAMWAVKAATCV
jgi:hypothetical protein